MVSANKRLRIALGSFSGKGNFRISCAWKGSEGFIANIAVSRGICEGIGWTESGFLVVGVLV